MKVEFHDNDQGAALCHIIENDRGEWKVKNLPNEGVTILTGYDGENIITVTGMTTQSGSFDVIAIECQVDNHLKFHRITGKPMLDVKGARSFDKAYSKFLDALKRATEYVANI